MLPVHWAGSLFNSSPSHLCETLQQPLAAVTSLNCQPQMTDTSSILPELHLQASLSGGLAKCTKHGGITLPKPDCRRVRELFPPSPCGLGDQPRGLQAKGK